MRNKSRLLTNVGVIILVIGISFMIGTIFRSTHTQTLHLTTGVSADRGPFTSPRLAYALPPRDLTIDLKIDEPVDIYLLDKEGRNLWFSEGSLDPVWSIKNASSQTVVIQLAQRDTYGFLLYSPNNSSATVYITGHTYGFERDLLWLSLGTIITGSIITIASIVLKQKNNKPKALPRKKKINFASKDLSNDEAPVNPSKINSIKASSFQQFRELLIWELEEYLTFPIIELLIVIAICTILSSPIVATSPALSVSNLSAGTKTIFMFLVFATGAIFCHSYTGSICKGETKMLLSYPVKRRYLFFSKFTVLFITIFMIYASVFVIQIYLLALNPLEPLFYASLLLLAIQLLLVCSIATTLSVITKNERTSILVSMLLFFGLENVSTGTSVISFSGRFMNDFAFINYQIHRILPPGLGVNSVPTLGETSVSLFVSVAISFFLIFLSYVYYSRKMEID